MAAGVQAQSRIPRLMFQSLPSHFPHGNGTPPSHDISSAVYHVAQRSLLLQLEHAVQASWTSRHQRYSDVKVLMLSWASDDLGVETEINVLKSVFTDAYHYDDVVHWKIPDKRPGHEASARIAKFLEQGGDPNNLLIVYYAGHGMSNVNHHGLPTWFANRQPNSPKFNSSMIQDYLCEVDDASPDVLFLYDTCHSANGHGSVESSRSAIALLAACGFESIAAEVGTHSFTYALIQELSEAATIQKAISIPQLHSSLLNRLHLQRQDVLLQEKDGKMGIRTTMEGIPLFERPVWRTPIYIQLSRNERPRPIMLAPLPSRSPGAHNTGVITLNASQPIAGTCTQPSQTRMHVLLRVSVAEDDFNLEEFKSWICEAPEPAKEIKVITTLPSCSTLLLLQMPVELWDMLPASPAISFVGFVAVDDSKGPSGNTPDSTKPHSGTQAPLNPADTAVAQKGKGVKFSFNTDDEKSAVAMLDCIDGILPALFRSYRQGLSPQDIHPEIWIVESVQNKLQQVANLSTAAFGPEEVIFPKNADLVNKYIAARYLLEHDNPLLNLSWRLNPVFSWRNYDAEAPDDQGTLFTDADSMRSDPRAARSVFSDVRTVDTSLTSVSKSSHRGAVARHTMLHVDEGQHRDKKPVGKVSTPCPCGGSRTCRSCIPGLNLESAARLIFGAHLENQPEQEDPSVTTLATRKDAPNAPSQPCGGLPALKRSQTPSQGGHQAPQMDIAQDETKDLTPRGKAVNKGPESSGRREMQSPNPEARDETSSAGFGDFGINPYAWRGGTQFDDGQHNLWGAGLELGEPNLGQTQQQPDQLQLSQPTAAPDPPSGSRQKGTNGEKSEMGKKSDKGKKGRKGKEVHSSPFTCLQAATTSQSDPFWETMPNDAADDERMLNRNHHDLVNDVQVEQQSDDAAYAHRHRDMIVNEGHLPVLDGGYGSHLGHGYAATIPSAIPSYAHMDLGLGYDAEEDQELEDALRASRIAAETEDYTDKKGSHPDHNPGPSNGYRAYQGDQATMESTGSWDPNSETSAAYLSSSRPDHELVAEDEAAYGDPTPTAPSPSTDSTIIGASTSSGQSEEIDSRYRVQDSHQFQPGQVFKILWSEPAGETKTEIGPHDVFTEKPEFKNEWGQRLYVGFRRFLIIALDEGHCTCVPILTYVRQGCAKAGVKPAKHGIIHEQGTKPRLLKGEPELGFRPVRMKFNAAAVGERLARESRVNYSKLVTVEYSAKVFFIGSTHWEDFNNIVAKAVEKCWDDKRHKLSSRRESK